MSGRGYNTRYRGERRPIMLECPVRGRGNPRGLGTGRGRATPSRNSTEGVSVGKGRGFLPNINVNESPEIQSAPLTLSQSATNNPHCVTPNIVPPQFEPANETRPVYVSPEVVINEGRQMSTPTLNQTFTHWTNPNVMNVQPPQPVLNIAQAVDMNQFYPNFLQQLANQVENLTLSVKNLTENQNLKIDSKQEPKIETAVTNYKTSLKLKDLPHYNGKLTPVHPVEFLEAVKLHFQSFRIPDEKKLFEISQILKEKALVWFNLYKYKNGANDFEKFCEEFIDFFWGPQVQDNVRGQLFTPNQYRKGAMDMTTYFMKFVTKAQYLDEKLPESILVATILKHFPPSVRRNLYQSRCRTIGGALEELRMLDEDPDILGAPSFESQQLQTKSDNSFKNKPPVKNNLGLHQISCDTSTPPPMFGEATSENGTESLN